jgi:hypothetical protein
MCQHFYLTYVEIKLQVACSNFVARITPALRLYVIPQSSDISAFQI